MAAPSCRAGAAATVLLASLLLLATVARGGGGAGEPAADRGAVGGPMECFTTCSTQLVGYIMTTIQCYNKCMAGGGGGGGGGAAAVAEAAAPVCAAKGDRQPKLERLLREAACGCDW